jgi:hypothetical protein
MNIKRTPIDRLRAILADTEREAGPQSVSVKILRREVERRERRQPRKAVRHAR